jgi:PadR family transcriptional regulator, regulatory protein PadR
VEHHDVLAGFVRLHILHHATTGEIYGLWMIDELAHHGYKLSPGTLYPMLKAMEKRGYLISREERAGRSVRRPYRTTPLGREALAVGQARLRELFREFAPAAGVQERLP